MTSRRSFLKLLGLVAVAPKALADILPWLDRQPKWSELLSPSFYSTSASGWSMLAEDFDTQTTKFVHQQYSVGFRVTRDMLEDLPEDHWIKKIPAKESK